MERTTSTKEEEKEKEQDKYDEDDIAQCPILKDKLGSYTPEQLKEMKAKYDAIIKPMMKMKKGGVEEEKKEKPAATEEKKPKIRQRHPRFETYRQSQGSCPYMNTSMPKSFKPRSRTH